MLYFVTITFVIGLAFVEGAASPSNTSFACGDGTEIPHEWVCDGTVECYTKEDEAHCACDSNKFSCVDRSGCIHFMQLCDDNHDCADSSDEEHASCKKTSQEVGTCLVSDFECRDGSRCLLRKFECDGTPHCDDGSDEGDRCENEKLDIDYAPTTISTTPIPRKATVNRKSIPKTCRKKPDQPSCAQYAAAMAHFLKPKFVCKCRRNPTKAKCVKKKVLVDIRSEVVCDRAPKRKNRGGRSKKAKNCLKNPNKRGCKKDLN